MDEHAILREEVERVAQSGALGRSRSYARLLEFLAACAVEGRTPKELEIAMHVFGKGADFDPSQDSLVRVYAHNLRQKLEHYYATQGRKGDYKLVLARGEYRLTATQRVERDDDVAAAPPRRDEDVVAETDQPEAAENDTSVDARRTPAAATRARWPYAVGAALVFAAGLVLGVVLEKQVVVPPPPGATIAASPVWSALFDDDLPVLVVVGDYYILGEVDGNNQVNRLVRDFAVNSSKDLDELYMYDPDRSAKYIDLGLTYLPRGSGFALLDLLRVVYAAKQNVRLMSVSELNILDLRTHHVIYVGYLSGLEKLEDFVFASSGLAVGDSYDELEDLETGKLYRSEAGFAGGANRSYRDYAFISTFPGPGGNQILIVAGTRDAGLMQAGQALSNATFVDSIAASRPDADTGAPAFEMLFEVTGFAHTNLDAMPVHTAALEYHDIWGGTQLTSR